METFSGDPTDHTRDAGRPTISFKFAFGRGSDRSHERYRSTLKDKSNSSEQQPTDLQYDLRRGSDRSHERSESTRIREIKRSDNNIYFRNTKFDKGGDPTDHTRDPVDPQQIQVSDT